MKMKTKEQQTVRKSIRQGIVMCNLEEDHSNAVCAKGTSLATAPSGDMT
jgi:hypothetical protein